METKRVFVTGATGFIGSHLVEELARRGHVVTCLVRNPKKMAGFSHLGLKPVIGDLEKTDKLKEHIKGQDVVFHLAAIRGELKIPWETYYKVNVEAVQRLVEISADVGVSKFLYISSVGVLGTSPLRVPADEETPYNPDSRYHKSKMLAEQAVLKLSKSLNTIVIRPTITYGPYDTGFLYRVARMVKGGFFPMVGVGNNKTHVLFVRGLVEALVKALEVECGTGQIYILGDKNPLEFRNLVQLVASSIHKKVRIIRVPFEPFMEFSKMYDTFIMPIVKGLSMEISFKLLSLPWHYNIEKAVEEIGYRPYKTEEMVGNTLDWYVQQGWL